MPRETNHPHSRRKQWLMKRRAARGASDPAQASAAPVGPPAGVLEARALWQRGAIEEAMRAYERVAAGADAATKPAVLVEAAGALSKRLETDRAERLLEELAGLPDRAGALPGQHRMLAGLGLIACYRPGRAMQHLAAALDKQPGNAAAGVELAALHERRGELDAAEAVLQRLNQPKLPAVMGVLGRVERRRGHTDRARALLTAAALCMATQPNDILTKARAGYELGRLHDEQGDYDAAWEALMQAKRAQRTLVKPGHPAAARARLTPHRQLIDRVTADDLRRWRSALPDDAAPSPRAALLTGLPRSGTTLLQRILDAHPGVLGADERHVLARVALPGLFDEREPPADPVAAFDAVPAERLARQRARYFDLMAQSLGEPLGDRVLLDKNPSMLRLLPGVARLLPGAPVLVALRDPRDVVVSMLFTWMPLNDVSVQLLAVDDAAEYAQQELDAWLVLREKLEGWTELRYEELVRDVPAVAKQAIEALGLAWDDALLNGTGAQRDSGSSAASAVRQVDSPTYEQVSKPVYTSAVGRWRNYESQLGKVLGRLDVLADRLG